MKKVLLALLLSISMANAEISKQDDDTRNYALITFVASAGATAISKKAFDLTTTQATMVGILSAVATAFVINEFIDRDETSSMDIGAVAGGAIAGVSTSFVLYKFNSGEW